MGHLLRRGWQMLDERHPALLMGPKDFRACAPEAALTKGAKRIAASNSFEAERERVNPLPMVLAMPRISRPRGQ